MINKELQVSHVNKKYDNIVLCIYDKKYDNVYPLFDIFKGKYVFN